MARRYICTCGHVAADHDAFCTLCGAETCARFDWALTEFRRFDLEDIHSTLRKSTELRLRLLHRPPTTDREILDVVTSLSKIKDAPERLRRLIDDLVEARRVPSHQAVVGVLLMGFRHCVNEGLDTSGRLSQGHMESDAWDKLVVAFHDAVSGLLALNPRPDLATRLVEDLHRLETDRTQWPAFVRDYRDQTARAPKRPRNPYQEFAKVMRAALGRFRLEREIETEILQFMGVISGEPEEPDAET